MAGTEDIAEKVAELLIEQGARAANMVTDTAPKVVEGFGIVTSDLMNQIVTAAKKDKELQKVLSQKGEINIAQMNTLIQKLGLKSSSVGIAHSDHKDFEGLLNRQGVLYATLIKQDDNSHHYIFFTKDQEKVANCMAVMNAQRGRVNELAPQLYFNELAPEQVHVVEGVSAVEMELFRHYARELDLLYTAIPRKEDYMVACSKEDTKKLQNIMLHTSWALTGANGARVREQVERRLAGRSAISISAAEADKELYIVSGVRPSTYIKISSNDYALYKNNKKVEGAGASRNDPDFFVKCLADCDGLDHPVVMSPQQFHENLTPEDMVNAHSIDLFPDFFDPLVEVEQTNRLVNLVSMKYGLDNEGDATWGLTDPSVSYAAFADYEVITDEDELEARRYEFEHFKQSAFYSGDHHTTYDVDMKEKNIDYIIAQAEEKKKAMEGKSRSHSGIDYSWRSNSRGEGDDHEK